MERIAKLKLLALLCLILFILVVGFGSLVLADQYSFWNALSGLISLALVLCYVSIVYRLSKALHLTNPGLWVLGSTFVPYVFLTILMFKKEMTIKSQNITVPSDSIVVSPHIQDSAFCEKCISETTDERPLVLRMINGIGTGWNYKNRDKCPKCNSVIKTKCFFIGFPLFPQEKYRVIFLTDKIKFNVQETRFFARKLKQQE